MLPENTQILTHLRGIGGGTDAGWPDYRPGERETVFLRNVEIHYVLMELPMQDALAILPPALHPSVPAHLTVTFHRVPDSPAGPFRFVVVGVGCRAGIRPRMLTTSVFASSQAGADFLRDHGRFPARVADVRVRNGHYGIDSTLSLDGDTLLDISTFAPEPVLGAGAAVKFCAPLNPVTHAGRRALLQVDIGYEYHETARGIPEIRAFEPSLIGPEAGRPQFNICGVRCLADIELHGDRLLYDAEIQAEEGGATLLAGRGAAQG